MLVSVLEAVEVAVRKNIRRSERGGEREGKHSLLVPHHWPLKSNQNQHSMPFYHRSSLPLKRAPSRAADTCSSSSGFKVLNTEIRIKIKTSNLLSSRFG